MGRPRLLALTLGLVVATALLGACSTFGTDDSGGNAGGQPSAEAGAGDELAPSDGGVVEDGGDGGVVEDGGDGGVVKDGSAAPAPSCTGGQALDYTDFETLPPVDWVLNDDLGFLNSDSTNKSAGMKSLKIGPYNDGTRAMISRVISLGAPKTERLCLSVDLAIMFSAAPGGFTEVLQIGLHPTAAAGPKMSIGVGANQTGVFLHFLGIASTDNRTYPVLLANSAAFHRWTFTANVKGLTAWVDGVQIAHAAFPLASLETLDISVGAQGSSSFPRPTITGWTDELRAVLLPP